MSRLAEFARTIRMAPYVLSSLAVVGFSPKLLAEALEIQKLEEMVKVAAGVDHVEWFRYVARLEAELDGWGDRCPRETALRMTYDRLVRGEGLPS